MYDATADGRGAGHITFICVTHRKIIPGTHKVKTLKQKTRIDGLHLCVKFLGLLLKAFLCRKVSGILFQKMLLRFF